MNRLIVLQLALAGMILAGFNTYAETSPGEGSTEAVISETCPDGHCWSAVNSKSAGIRSAAESKKIVDWIMDPNRKGPPPESTTER